MAHPKTHYSCLRQRLAGTLVFCFAVMLTMSGLSATQAHALEALSGDRMGVQTLNVPLYKSRIVQLDGPVSKVSIGNKEVADILVMRAHQVYVLGKGIGTTNILLWDKHNNLTQSLDIEVTPDLNSLKAKLHQLLPGENVRVTMSQGAIVLTGEVTNAVAMDTAMKIAHSYLQAPDEEGATTKGEVINLMSIGGSQQVMLKVTVAEMSRTVMKKLGIQFNSAFNTGNWSIGGVSGGASFPDAIFEQDAARVLALPGNSATLGPVLDEFLPNPMTIGDKGLFAGFLSSDFLFNIAIDAAKENGLAKILAEPTLTTLTGSEAEFLSGGEFPIPVPQGDDGIGIEFKDFGVGLKFLPVVLDSGKINLNLNVSVSELTSASSVLLSSSNTSSVFLVPSLTKRTASSTVELGDGQTIAIAGLLNENMRDVVNKFPGLGDLPILGHLFRSQEYEKGETELVIMVTPTLAKPFIAEKLTLPGDGIIEPTDTEFYLLGRTHSVKQEEKGSEEPQATSDPSAADAEQTASMLPASGGSESNFGHSIN